MKNTKLKEEELDRKSSYFKTAKKTSDESLALLNDLIKSIKKQVILMFCSFIFGGLLVLAIIVVLSFTPAQPEMARLIMHSPNQTVAGEALIDKNISLLEQPNLKTWLTKIQKQ